MSSGGVARTCCTVSSSLCRRGISVSCTSKCGLCWLLWCFCESPAKRAAQQGSRTATWPLCLRSRHHVKTNKQTRTRTDGKSREPNSQASSSVPLKRPQASLSNILSNVSSVPHSPRSSLNRPQTSANTSPTSHASLQRHSHTSKAPQEPADLPQAPKTPHLKPSHGSRPDRHLAVRPTDPAALRPPYNPLPHATSVRSGEGRSRNPVS